MITWTVNARHDIVTPLLRHKIRLRNIPSGQIYMKYQFNTCIWVNKANKMKPRQTVLSLLASLLTQDFPRTIEEVTQRCIPKFIVLTLWYAYTGAPPGMRKWARCTRLRRASQLQAMWRRQGGWITNTPFEEISSEYGNQELGCGSALPCTVHLLARLSPLQLIACEWCDGYRVYPSRVVRTTFPPSSTPD